MYGAGKYGVAMMTVNGEFHVTKGFTTERAARDFGNYLYKKSTTAEVEIYRESFYKKRRCPVTIAKATKNNRSN